MARILGEPRHTLAIQDPVSGSVVTLYYRGPTSEERVAYQLSAFRFEGGERRFCLGETRLKFGLEILTGFGAGDFIIAAEGGETPWTRPGIRTGRSVSPKMPRIWCRIWPNRFLKACGWHPGGSRSGTEAGARGGPPGLAAG